MTRLQQIPSLTVNSNVRDHGNFNIFQFVILLTIVCMCSLAPQLGFASIETQLDKNTSQLKTLKQKLDSANEDVDEIRKQLAVLANQTRALISQSRNDRLELKTEQREMRGRIQDQKHVIDDFDDQLIRLNTKLKLTDNESQRQKTLAEIAQVKSARSDAVVVLEKQQTEMAQVTKVVEEAKLIHNPIYIELSKRKKELQGNFDQARRDVNQLKRNIKDLNLQRRTLLAKVVESNPAPAAISRKANTKITDAPTISAAELEEEQIEVAPPAYVFVISGSEDIDINDTLQLKEWVESYGAIFKSGSWNDLKNSDSAPEDFSLFVKQISAEFAKVPSASKIILIGHGLGGGAAIKAATEIAVGMNREVDLLVTLDPLGLGNLRANIVYQSDNLCPAPTGDPAIDLAYADCISTATPRTITSNVKHFVNRWQKDSNLSDDRRQLNLSPEVGAAYSVKSATGKFKLSHGVDADQRRSFYNRNNNAHFLLLSDAANNLPNLLIDYLR